MSDRSDNPASFSDRLAGYGRLRAGEFRQVMPEPLVVYRLVEAMQPDVFVEVGSAWGGSLYVYAGACAPGSLVISLDNGRNAASLARVVHVLRDEGYDARWLRGDSHSVELQTALAEAVGGRYLGFLHVDGDHTYDGVMADWRAYSPLVRPGGLIALHDVIYGKPGCGVPQAWAEIRAGETTWCEVLGPPWRNTNHRVGVGLVWR